MENSNNVINEMFEIYESNIAIYIEQLRLLKSDRGLNKTICVIGAYTIDVVNNKPKLVLRRTPNSYTRSYANLICKSEYKNYKGEAEYPTTISTLDWYTNNLNKELKSYRDLRGKMIAKGMKVN